MDEWVTIKSNISGNTARVNKKSLDTYIGGDNPRWFILEDEEASETSEGEGESQSSTDVFALDNDQIEVHWTHTQE